MVSFEVPLRVLQDLELLKLIGGGCVVMTRRLVVHRHASNLGCRFNRRMFNPKASANIILAQASKTSPSRVSTHSKHCNHHCLKKKRFIFLEYYNSNNNNNNNNNNKKKNNIYKAPQV